jgi:hypothetical protein
MSSALRQIVAPDPQPAPPAELTSASPRATVASSQLTFREIVDLKTAKALDLTLPSSPLARADQVLE